MPIDIADWPNDKPRWEAPKCECTGNRRHTGPGYTCGECLRDARIRAYADAHTPGVPLKGAYYNREHLEYWRDR